MNLTTFDHTKPCHTKEGGEAEYVCELNDPQYPHGFKFRKANGLETLSGFTVNGRYSNDAVDDKWDLVNDGERITACGVLNVYPGGVLKVYNSQDTADAYSNVLGGRITSIPLTVDIPKP